MQRWSEARRFPEMIVEEKRESALITAEGWRRPDTVWRDGSRQEDGGVGATCVWKGREGWTGRRFHLGTNKEVLDAEDFAIYQALQTIERREERGHSYTIFVDSTSAIDRVRGDQLGPGQSFAVAAIEACSRTTDNDNSVASGGSRHTAGPPATRWWTNMQRVRPLGKSQWRPYLRDTPLRHPFRT